MKNFRRGSALALAAAVAIGAAYACRSGTAALIAARRSPPPVEAVALAKGPSVVRAPSALAPNLLEAADACPFCFGEMDLSAIEAEPADLLGQPVFAAGLADTGGVEYEFAGLAPQTAAAPASEISTAAMLTLGIVGLTAWRRKGKARWPAAWRLTAAAQAG